jgi:hypothetical protein
MRYLRDPMWWILHADTLLFLALFVGGVMAYGCLFGDL